MLNLFPNDPTINLLLSIIHLHIIYDQEQMSVFAMNGFGDLQSFCEIREADLDYMGIMAPEQRAKILAAVQVMHDYQCKHDLSITYFSIELDLIGCLCYSSRRRF